jgi:hypothetical protein
MADIETLARHSEDALGNHFQVIIPTFPGCLDIDGLNLRTLTFDNPTPSIGTYTITKRGRTMTRPTGINDIGNELTFSYRVDRYYNVYNSINAWLYYIQNPETGAMGSDAGAMGSGGPSTYRVPITVLAKDTNDNLLAQWNYTGCYPLTQDAISFDEESGDPLTAAVTINFIKAEFPKGRRP